MVQASGVRIGWDELPATVRDAVERILGDRVVEAVSQSGGFSPGTADRVRTAGGNRAFVKAVSAAQNEHSPQLHRREAAAVAALPAGVPAPRLLGFHDDGEWVALIFEDVDGRQPHVPWRQDELAAVLDALDRLAVPMAGLPSLSEQQADNFAGWRRIAADPPADLDPWAAGNLDVLVELGERGVTAIGGEYLVHTDIRADNILLRPDGSVAIVDWPWAALGARWVDTMLLMLNVRLYGGQVTDEHLDTLGDPADITAGIAGFTAYFVDFARQAPPPGLPTIREFQQAQADVMLPWLKSRLA